MSIRHTKVSVIPDDPDTGLVRPSDWNADHTPPTLAEVLVAGNDAQGTLPVVAQAWMEIANFATSLQIDATGPIMNPVNHAFPVVAMTGFYVTSGAASVLEYFLAAYSDFIAPFAINEQVSLFISDATGANTLTLLQALLDVIGPGSVPASAQQVDLVAFPPTIVGADLSVGPDNISILSAAGGTYWVSAVYYMSAA